MSQVFRVTAESRWPMTDDGERCRVCSRTDSIDGNEMLLCQGNMCEIGYHLRCLEPPLQSVPEEMWLCPVCQASGDQHIPRRIISCGHGPHRLYKVEWDGGETTLEPRKHLIGTQALQLHEQTRDDGGSRPGAELPPGWTSTTHDPSVGRRYVKYHGPGGQPRARSVREAWRMADSAAEPSEPPAKDADLVLKHAISSTATTSTTAPSTFFAASIAEWDRRTFKQRKRRILLPDDDKVGKRIRVGLTDEERGMGWVSAKILEARPCITSFSDSNVEYLLRFDFDGAEISIDLEDVAWEYMCDDEESDEQTRGTPRACSTCTFQCSSIDAHCRMCGSALCRTDSSTEQVHVSTAVVPTVVPAQNSCTRAVQTEAALLGSELAFRSDPVSRLVEDIIQCVLARARDETARAADDLPIMRPLRSIEWFAGSARLSFALRRNHKWGHAMIHDYNPSKVEWEQHGMQPDPATFRSDEFLDEVRLSTFYQEPAYDYFHLSIDCSSFTGLGHAGQSRNEGNDYLGGGASCARGNRMVHKTCDLLGIQMERNPRFLFTVENPFTGRLKEHPMVRARLEAPREHGGLGAVRIVVDYCLFYDHNASAGRGFKKRTIFWTNSPTMIREFGEHTPPARVSHYLCEYNTPCPCYKAHRAVNSSTAAEATPFPKLLAEKIAQCVNLDVAKQRWRPARC